MSESESLEMHKEWRAIVLNKLTSLELGQKSVADEISNIKSNFVKQAEINTLQGRVDELEKFKWKLVGAMLALQGVWAVITFLVLYWNHSLK